MNMNIEENTQMAERSSMRDIKTKYKRHKSLLKNQNKSI